MVRYSKEDVLNAEERQALIEQCKTTQEQLVIKGLLYTGMRAGEFANLKESWLDWQKGLIYIPKGEGAWHPKTKAGSRQIPLVFEIKKLLYDHLREHKEIGMSRVTLFRVVKRVGSRLNLMKKVYPHALRATFATMMAEKGMGAADIQLIMGWSKLETANSYVRSTMAMDNFREKMEGMK